MLDWLRNNFRHGKNASAALELKEQADKFFSNGNYAESIKHYRESINIKPDYAEAFVNLSNVFIEQNDAIQAENCLRQAIRLKPELAVANFNLGSLLFDIGKANDALQYLEKSANLNSSFSAAYFKLGQCYSSIGLNEKAIEAYIKTIELEPGYAPALVNIGNVYLETGQPEKAEASYLEAIKSNPQFVDTYQNIAVLLSNQGRHKEAIEFLKAANEISPGNADTYYFLGLEYGFLEQRIEACENFSKCIQYNPQHLAASASLAHQLQNICSWVQLDTLIEKIKLLIAEAPNTSASKNWIPPFTYLSFPGVTALEQKICTEKYVNRTYSSVTSIFDKNIRQAENLEKKIIRIGYLSADFHDHATSRLFVRVLELHDKSKFHITGFSYGPDDNSQMRRRVKDACDSLIDIRNLSDIDAAKLISNSEIDILVDLKGYTYKTRSGILAFRPAPVQVNYLGYPGTMGAKFVDYIIADPYVIPEEHKQYYTEKIAWLPDCYQPTDDNRILPPASSRSENGLPEGAFVFCCFNQTYKISKAVFEVWCKLLKNKPDSILWLLESNLYAESNLRNELQDRGIDPTRLVMAPMVMEDAHLARIQCADLFLDTLPVNAHTTCSDAIWVGLPVITCADETFASRVAGSILRAANVPELITDNLEDYYTLALELANNPVKLKALSMKILDTRKTMPLFDSEKYTLNLERVFEEMMKAHHQES